MRESTAFYAIAQLWIVGALLASCKQISYFMAALAVLWFVGAIFVQFRENKD
jgi:hypothetical protein